MRRNVKVHLISRHFSFPGVCNAKVHLIKEYMVKYVKCDENEMHFCTRIGVNADLDKIHLHFYIS